VKIKISIIGGGPASISLCNQLIHHFIVNNLLDVEISVFEKKDSIGTGLPYSYKESCYILNLPSYSMGISGEEDESFYRWFERNRIRLGCDYETAFPPRYFFGLYVNQLASRLIDKAESHGIKLHYHVNTKIINIEKMEETKYRVSSKKESYLADYVILSTGHMPSESYRHLVGVPGYSHSPWSYDAFDHLDRNSTVFILGSRLTAIDIAMRLHFMGHQGSIKMFSRSGLLPAVLGSEVPPYVLKYLTLKNLDFFTKNGLKYLELDDLLNLFWKEISEAVGSSIQYKDIITSSCDTSALDWLLHEISSAERGPRPWQQVLFSLYPITPLIWNRLSLEDKEIFLKDYHSLFFTYLAAFPLENAYKLLEILKSGQLTVEGGLESVVFSKEGFHLYTKSNQFFAEKLFNGTGPGYNPFGFSLFQNMNKNGLLERHPCGGIYVDPETLQVKDSKYIPQSNLFAIGELTRGTCLVTADMGQVNRQTDRITDQITKLMNKFNQSQSPTGCFHKNKLTNDRFFRKHGEKTQNTIIKKTYCTYHSPRLFSCKLKSPRNYARFLPICLPATLFSSFSWCKVKEQNTFAKMEL